MMERGALPRGWGCILLACAAIAGCGDGGSADATGSGTTASVSPLGSSSAAGSSAPAFEPKAFCEKLCKRSADCGLQKVEALAKSGDPTDLATLEKEKARRAEVESSCIETCTKGAPSGSEIERAKKAEACLDQKDCGPFEGCLQSVAAEK